MTKVLRQERELNFEHPAGCPNLLTFSKSKVSKFGGYIDRRTVII